MMNFAPLKQRYASRQAMPGGPQPKLNRAQHMLAAAARRIQPGAAMRPKAPAPAAPPAPAGATMSPAAQDQMIAQQSARQEQMKQAAYSDKMNQLNAASPQFSRPSRGMNPAMHEAAMSMMNKMRQPGGVMQQKRQAPPPIGG